MMLIVIPHVERYAIDWPVITERLLIEIVRVMLLNPARAHRMQPDRKHECEHEIKKTGPATEIDYGYIVYDRACQVGREPAVPHLDRLEPRRACHLEKRKEHQPDGFPIPFVAHQSRLPMVRQVGVPFVIALMRMMLQMVNTKAHRAGREVWQIGDDRDHFVPAWAPKNQIVRRIMNDHVIGVVGEGTDAKRQKQT